MSAMKKLVSGMLYLVIAAAQYLGPKLLASY